MFSPAAPPTNSSHLTLLVSGGPILPNEPNDQHPKWDSGFPVPPIELAESPQDLMCCVFGSSLQEHPHPMVPEDKGARLWGG